MSKSAPKSKNIIGFMAILVLSAAMMLWLFWRFPLATGVLAVAILAGLGLSARLARWIESDAISELERRKQRA